VVAAPNRLFNIVRLIWVRLFSKLQLIWGHPLIKEFSVELGQFDDLRQTKLYFSTSNTFEGGVTQKDKGLCCFAAYRLFSY
jgi:hypothetical protein